MGRTLSLRRLLCTLLGPALALTACDDSITFPDADPYLEGVVVSYEAEASVVWVKEGLEDECGIRFGVEDAVVGIRPLAGEVQEIAVDDLQEGDLVRVWVDDRYAITDSCPGRGVAAAIEVIPSDG